ncbi:MAG: hypothetical protein K1X89_11900 [Myxococcaceae bacterium]|nr:hypothetical protein [Myxococcaceae bacterium]
MKTATLLMLCLSAAAWAERPELSASFGFASELMTSSQYDLVSADDPLRMYRVAAAGTFAAPRGHVDVELGWRSGAASATAHGTLSSSLWVRGVDVSAGYRFAWLKHLEPYARAGVGLDWASLSLTGSSALEQTVLHPSGTFLGGLQFPFALGVGAPGGLAFVVDLGVGYVVRPAYTFDALAPPPPSGRQEDPIARGAVNLGSMPLSGFTWRLGVTVRL